MTPNVWSKLGRGAFGLPLLAGLVFLSVAFSGWGYDDPFITYRYAANLIDGQGFVYNSGERVLSTTTPLFALLLAGLGRGWDDLPALANLISVVSLALGGLCLWDLARRWGAPLAAWAGVLLYPTFPLLVTTIGSEVPLYLALCLGAFAFYARQRFTLAAGCAALATLTRADGLIVAGLLAAHYALQSRREARPLPWPGLAVFLGLTLPWFLFAAGYFGAPFPVTLAAKQRQGAMAISQRFAPGLLTVLGWYASRWQHWVEAGFALLGVVFAGVRARRWGLFFAWSAAYFAAYTLLGVSRYPWYYASLVPGFLAAVGLGCEWLAESVRRAWPTLAPLSRPAGVGGLIVLAALQTHDAHRLSRQPDVRMAIYRAAGEWLRANTDVDATVGALEVGAIGYYAQRSMVDFAGLLQSDIAEQLTPSATYEDAARWSILNYRPDYLVLNPLHFAALLPTEVAPHCHEVYSFYGPDYGYPGALVIYACPDWSPVLSYRALSGMRPG